MTNWLVKAADTAKSSWNVVSSVGSILISQSDSMSEAYARHLSRCEAVEAGKELLMQEIQMYTEIKKDLLKRWVTASALERIQLKKDVEEISSSLGQLNVAIKALGYISSEKEEQPKTLAVVDGVTIEHSQQEVTQHWLDKFGELTRTHNEPWREELLARALAKESSAPGTVPARALWLLGTLEEKQFIAFATILDLCSVIDDGLAIPSHLPFNNRPIPNCVLDPNDKVSIGHLIYRLQEVGLLADPNDSFMQASKASFIAAYDTIKVSIDASKGDFQIRGVMLTNLGESVAGFCERKFNSLGKEIFDAWLNSLKQTTFSYSAIA
jgi:Protein of unknown function (DUF2806)